MARGDVVVTVEFQVFKGSGNPEPARHGRGFSSRYTRLADDDYVAAAHRPADQHHFQFDRSLRRQIARSKKKYAGRTDVARHQGNRKVFGSAVDTAQAQGKAQTRARVLALLRKDANRMGRNAGKAPHRIERPQRHNAQRRHARRTVCRRSGDGSEPGHGGNGLRPQRSWPRGVFLFLPDSLTGCVHLALGGG